MDEEKNQFDKEKEEILTGQMSYDEISYDKVTPKIENNEVIDGQENIFDLKKQNNHENNVENKPKRKSKKALIETDSSSIIYRSLDEVMHSSMIPYTEHVVLDRALPRVEDGLKPVQRRILYSMLELGLSPDKPYRKSARIVGDCMGKYHPHGDSSVYDAMVRMSQDFSLREPLVKGHGNFGSIDGDNAAAMRYTEAKLTPLAMELLKDIEKNTVKWSFNFDDTLKEPDILPGRFPNLLINGASGIAVGVATNIPPHNLEEVINGVIEYISNSKITLDEMMKIIKGPDFPTGAIIIAGDELKQAYQTGKGKIILRAKTTFEKNQDKNQIVISELPYQVNKANLLAKIADLKSKEKEKLSQITEIRDESDRQGLRAVIKLKKDANEKAILEYLYKSTQLQVTFGINMVAIADGRPKQLGLLEIISYYVEYQRQVIVNRTKYDLDLAKERAHIVEGLLVAIANIDKVIKIIKQSATVSVAKQTLKSTFDITEKQAQAILDMRLARLVNLEVFKLKDELKELLEKIKKYESILSSKKVQYNLIKTELTEIKKQFKNARRSEIVSADEISQEVNLDIDTHEAFAKEVVIGLTAQNTIKQISIKNYSLSSKEITSSSTLFDVHTMLYKTMSNKQMLFFTNYGNCAKINVSSIPLCKWREKGCLLLDIVKNANINERVVSIFEFPKEIKKDEKMFIYTKMGYIKCVKYEDIIISKSFYSVINLKENDEVIEVEMQNESANIVMVTKFANALCFSKEQVPCQSRNAGGVMGISLEKDDEVLVAKQSAVKGLLTLITENGFAKKLPITEINVSSRYRKGQSVIKFDDAKKLIYVSYSEIPSNIVLVKGQKLIFVQQRNISYDVRTSKGKQILKSKLTKGFNFEV